MLTKDNKKVLKEMLDDWIDLSGWKEMLSDIAINVGVDQIDKQLFDRYISPESEEKFNQIFEYVKNKQYANAVAHLNDIRGDLINMPWFDDVSEELFWEGLFTILEAIILQIQNNAGKD